MADEPPFDDQAQPLVQGGAIGTPEDSAKAAVGIGRCRAWLGGAAAAFEFLFPFQMRRKPCPTIAFRHAAAWVLPFGVLICLLWVGGFRATWRIYGEIEALRVVPALTVVLIECLLTGPALMLGLARTVHLLTGERPTGPEGDHRDPLSPVGTLVLCLVILTEWVLIMSFPPQSPWWPSETDWRHYFNWFYPAPIYRPLVLAPIWGRWGIMLAAIVGRTARHADKSTSAFAASLTPISLLLYTLVPALLTIIYCSREGNFVTGATISLIVFACTFAVAIVMVFRAGGQTRRTMYAAGLIAQLALLAAYRAFWPVIHGQ